MAESADRLTATVVRVQTFKLKRGRTVVVADLDVPYLHLIRFLKALAPAGSTVRRKRIKHGLPDSPRRKLIMHLLTLDGRRISVDGDIAMSHPLDAPASVSLNVNDAADVTSGSRLELTVCEEH